MDAIIPQPRPARRRRSTRRNWWPTRASCCRPRWPSTWASGAGRRAPRPGARARPGQPRRQAPDPRHVGARGRRLIDDADALRAGDTGRVLGFAVKAASTLGTFLRSFGWAMSASSTRSAGRSGTGLGDGCRTGRRPAHDRPRLDDLRDLRPPEGGRRLHTVHRRPRLSPAARGRRGHGRRAHARLREGRANTGRGAGHFLARRSAGSATRGRGASSRCAPTPASTPTPWSGSAGRWMSTSASRPPARAGPPPDRGDPGGGLEADPYWLAGGADVAETSYVPVQTGRTAPRPLIVRRVRPTPGLTARPLDGPTATTPSLPTGPARPSGSRPTTAAMPRSRTRSATSSTAGA